MTTSLNGLRVAVAGAGVLGLAIAASAARRGARVIVFDPAARGDNASGVAAGMVSPGLEAMVEGGDATRYALFRRAYDAWPHFAASLGLSAEARAGACVLAGDGASLEVLASRLGDLGVRAEQLEAADLHARQPLYAGDRGGLFVAEDARIDPLAMLDALAASLLACGGHIVSERLDPCALPPAFDRLVIAAGYEARAWAAATPELGALSPIKGHILHFALPGRGGATLRADEGYLAPQAAGVAFGATMEAGRANRALDPVTVADLHRRAVALAPALAAVDWVARTGVRAATPDGLPTVGASASGAILATGARRNGWLLAPLVAEAAMEALSGAPPWPAFDPARFGDAGALPARAGP